MAYDAQGNFYNPYEPGTFEYDYEESQRSQPAVELTPEQQAQEIAAYQTAQANQLPIDWSVAQRYLEQSGGSDKWLNSILPAAISVASLLVPGVGQTLGAEILANIGITGATADAAAAAVGLTAKELGSAVGASAISAATTALQGGSVEDVIKSAAGAGAANGLNMGLGGGVLGATAGSAAGTLIKGGDVGQIITNALAAAAGAGAQDVLKDNPDAGKIIGTAARTYIATGGNLDQTLLNTAASAIGAANQPAKTAQQTQAAAAPDNGGLSNAEFLQDQQTAAIQDAAAREQALADYQEKLKQYEIEKALYDAKYPPKETVATAEPVATTPAQDELSSQTIVAKSPDVAPVVTSTDLTKKIAPQPTPAVDNKTLQSVLVQGQKEVAPVEIGTTSPVQTPNITVPPVQPSQADEKLAEPGFEAYPITGPKLEDVKVQAYTEKPPEVVTDVPVSVAPKVVSTTPVAPVIPAAPATPVELPPNTPKLEDVLVRAKAETAPVVTDVVLPTPPVAPVAPTAPTSPVPQVAPAAAPAEPAKTTLYPTVTGVTSSTSTAPVSLTQSTQTDATANSANATKTSSTIPTFRVGDLGKYLSPLASYEADRKSVV
jgi:hypothetical protein